jgi:hypothetical protein
MGSSFLHPGAPATVWGESGASREGGLGASLIGMVAGPLYVVYPERDRLDRVVEVGCDLVVGET